MIKVFTKDNCPYCVAVTGFLKRNNIPFEVSNISEDESAKEAIISMGFSSVPVTVIPGQLPIVGFDIKKFKELV